MSENKGESQSLTSQVSPSSKEPKEEELITSTKQVHPSELAITAKRPRFSPNPTGQWKPVSSPPLQKIRTQSQITGAELTNPTTTHASVQMTTSHLPASSSDTASSPSHSPGIPAYSDAGTVQLRKGKYVSPVWKPHEMLWLARAWRLQYQGGSDPDHGTGEPGGRGKTRAEKDREVAEFLKNHGVNRDAKTAGTKWDNMLGEFRKVFEWERGGERDQVGKSYFRLSPYERKLHRLPASFDEEVFDELAEFMGSRIRSSSSLILGSHGRGRSPALSFFGSFGGDESMRGSSLVKSVSQTLLPPFRKDDSSCSGRTRQLTMGASGGDQSYQQGAKGNLGFDQESPMDIMGPFPSSSSNELRRIGRIKMTWEESVSLWTDQEGENHEGRVNLGGSGFLHADELTYFDDSMVACAFESFSDGPLKGFSVDKFFSGQQLKVLGKRKSALIASAPSGVLRPAGPIERVQLRPLVAPARSTPSWEVSDPTGYYMGCLRCPPPTLPSMTDLSWHLQDPPPEELRFPIQGDLYRDLPPGKELFTTTSNDLLDSKSFTLDILSPLIRTPTTLNPPTSRDSFITLWDDCINRIITRFCPIPLIHIRKPPSKSDKNLLDQWPNVTGFIKGMCLWRGEETDKLREGVQTNPSTSIAEKLFWCYADLPYILGYHAVGPVVTFCALCRSPHDDAGNTKIVRTDLLSLDLSVPSGRMKALVPCWRIACLLPLLADRFLTVFPRYSDFAFRVDHGTGNVIAEMTPCTVTRFYSSKEKWSAAKEVYDVLGQQVPYTERVSRWSEPDLSISFMPRGFKAKPITVEELVEALKHVTKVLVALHDLSFMHRDLSWDNVLRRCDKESEWVVCGFEDMVVAPQINSSLGYGCGSSVSIEGKNAPEMGRGVHGVKVDVWGIGFLLRTSDIGGAGLPSQLRELETRCLDQNPEKRPTAADCYHQLLQFQAAATVAGAGDSYAG